MREIIISAIIIAVGVSCFAIGWYARKDLHPEGVRGCMFAREPVEVVDNS